MSITNDLISNAKEYFKNAFFAQKRKQYHTSVTLFFKSLSALADLHILINEKKIPSSHTERFRILEKKYPEIYDCLDKNFPFYQDSYNTKLNLETSKIFENDCRKIFKIIEIKI
jgi:hypothetical protein